MKIAIVDLKKAIKWLETNSNDTHVEIKFIDNMLIQCCDKYLSSIEITLFSESNLLPKIRKEDLLP